VAEEAAGGPFGEFDFGFDFRAEPGVVGHFVGGDALAPLATARRSATTWRSATRGRQVGEWTFFGGDPLMHRMYQPHLERAGYQVISLTDGAEALEVAIREQPRVVVMDMMLPGTDGLAATLALKAAESTKNIPVIAISGDLSYLGLRQQLESIGAEAFLSKPFGAAKLVSEIQRLDKDRGA